MNPSPELAPTAADRVPAPEEHLLRLLGEWRQLTEGETRAIRLGDWKDIAVQQRRKEQLQHAITAVLNRSRLSQAAQENATQSARVRLAVSELTALELRNRELLAVQCETQRMELARVQGATRQLQGLRRAYGRPGASVWQSYS